MMLTTNEDRIANRLNLDPEFEEWDAALVDVLAELCMDDELFGIDLSNVEDQLTMIRKTFRGED